MSLCGWGDSLTTVGGMSTTMLLPYREIDVFATTAFSGNPLAVIAKADILDDAQMARIAEWTNLSETAFLLTPTEPTADYRVRIFTPTGELPFAGHPTLGSARAWLDMGFSPRGSEIVQECEAGLVPIRMEPDRLSFATPPLLRSGPLESTAVDSIAEALSISREDILDHAWGDNGPGWQMVRLRDADAVRALRPNDNRGELKIGVVGLEPDNSPHAYTVRAILPDREDPVTGSLNGAIAQWLQEHNGHDGHNLVPQTYTATQGTGLVHIHNDNDNDAIWIGGTAMPRVRGAIEVENNEQP